MADYSKLEASFEHMVWGLTNDIDTQNDLLQIMRLRVWKMESGQTKTFYLQCAKTAAIDFLRKHYTLFENKRREVPMSQLSRCDFDFPDTDLRGKKRPNAHIDKITIIREGGVV